MPRDIQMLTMIYLCDGIMARRQLEDLFFAGKNKSQARRRLRELYDRVYLNQPHNERQCASAPEHIYWLDRRGYEQISQIMGDEVIRNWKKIRTFNTMILQHHLEVVDLRLKVMRDVKDTPDLRLSRWVTERQFRSWKHRVKYTDWTRQEVEKGVEPDGFFALVWRAPQPGGRGKARIHSFLVEQDRGTEDLDRIRTKLLANAAYLDSQVFKETLGVKTGRNLMVTTGWERARHMMELAQELRVPWAWLFTTFEEVMNPDNNMVLSPIWRRADGDEAVSLIPARPRPGAGAAGA